MCGIAGAIGNVDRSIAEAVEAMSRSLVHRGPDDQGQWRSEQSNDRITGAILAFRRLAIIELSQAGHQPMIDVATGNVVVFNGEIYNFESLRRTLRRLGHEFRSSSDTEVLLKAFNQWGPECVRQLRGMFAFAIWNARDRTVMLARDRIGIKPLYIVRVRNNRPGATVLFASEVRALLECGLLSRRISQSGLQSFAWNGFVIGPDSIVDQVQLMPAGTLAVFDEYGREVHNRKYWSLPINGANQDDHCESSVEELGESLATSVKQHLVSDVPLGVFLSGGIDSSAVAAMAVREKPGAIKTFTIGFDESSFDESTHARQVAEALGTEHVEIRLTQQQFHRHLHDALEAIDQPTFDAINTWFVSRAVREAGITVALAGTGGDELFGGYRSFRDLPRAMLASRAVAPARSLMQLANTAYGGLATAVRQRVPPQTRWGKLGDVLCAKGSLVDLYQTSYALFTRDFVNRLMTIQSNGHTRQGLPSARYHEIAETLRTSHSRVSGRAVLEAISALELTCFVGERLLRDTDAASMAVSLEARVPLLDHEVIEAAARVPAERRFEPLGRKQLLRDIALGKLDPSLFERPKSGFVFPFDRWCREALAEELEDVFGDARLCRSVGLNHATVARLWQSFKNRAPGIYWSRIWAVFVLLWWCRRHKVTLES